MKFLFILQYPGYLRYFDSVIRLLAERGHSVALGFDSPHKQPEGADALDGATGDIHRRGRTGGGFSPTSTRSSGRCRRATGSCATCSR